MDVNAKSAEPVEMTKEEAMEKGYQALANDPEFQQENRRKKVMRGVIRRRSAINLRWPNG